MPNRQWQWEAAFDLISKSQQLLVDVTNMPADGLRLADAGIFYISLCKALRATSELCQYTNARRQ